MTTDCEAETLESLARREAAVLQRPWDAEAWGQLGLEYRCAGYHEIALPVLRRGAELGTSEPYHWFHLSNALDQAGEHEQALEAARKAVAIAPDSNRMLATLGTRLLACGKPHEAIRCLEQVARRVPDWAEGKGMLGIAHYRVQQFAAAAEWLEAALRIDPEGPDASVWAFLGVSLDEIGRFEGAVYALETAVYARPDYGWAWARMGKALRALDRHAEAVGAYEKAVEHDFAPAILLWDMGLSAIEIREAACADRACRALRKLDPGMATKLRRRLRDPEGQSGRRAGAGRDPDMRRRLTMGARGGGGVMEQTLAAPCGLLSEQGTPVPLVGVSARAEIRDYACRVVLSQRFRNDETQPIEAVYKFPLDEGAAVCGFEVEIDGRLIKGRVEEREKAFEHYDEALTAGHGAYLVDEERADVFTASVGNLPPGKEAVLRLTIVSELALEGDAIRFTLPTTIAPRYAPAEDRKGVGETEAERVSPPYALQVPYGLTLEVDVRTTAPVRSVESPSHPISVTIEDGRATVRLSEREAALDRDVVLKIALAETHEPRAVVERGPDGRAYALVSFRPKLDAALAPAEVVFVVDRSGSMQGSSIAEARNALQLALRSLRPGCRFNVVGFGSTFEPLFPESRRLRRREPGRGHAAREAARGRPGRHRDPARARARVRVRASGGPPATGLRPDRRRGQQHRRGDRARPPARRRHPHLHLRHRRRRQPPPGEGPCPRRGRRGRVHRTGRADRGQGAAAAVAGPGAGLERRSRRLGRAGSGAVPARGAAGLRRRPRPALREAREAPGGDGDAQGHGPGGAGRPFTAARPRLGRRGHSGRDPVGAPRDPRPRGRPQRAAPAARLPADSRPRVEGREGEDRDRGPEHRLEPRSRATRLSWRSRSEPLRPKARPSFAR